MHEVSFDNYKQIDVSNKIVAVDSSHQWSHRVSQQTIVSGGNRDKTLADISVFFYQNSVTNESFQWDSCKSLSWGNSWGLLYSFLLLHCFLDDR